MNAVTLQAVTQGVIHAEPCTRCSKPARTDVTHELTLQMCWLFNAAKISTQLNAVANIEGAVTQAVVLDEVPAVVKDGVDE